MNNKPTVVVSCPIDSYSGYGARSRDFVKALLDTGKYDVYVLPQKWGSTRTGYLENHKEVILKSILIFNLQKQPDIWIQITVPQEFQKIGKYNIGVTAGIETNICSPKWIEGCNRMELVLTSSEHSKNVFENSKYKDETSGRVLQLTTPMEVLFEGVKLDTYFKLPPEENTFNLDEVEESFNFLFVGHWLPGHYGHDRKNIGFMIKSFLETFKNKKDAPGLILKTQSANASIMDRDKMLKAITDIKNSVKGTLPNVYIIHGEVTDEEINMLYNHPKIKAMVSFTKGEGFGRPLLEFSTINKPVIASNWSGHTDFLQKEYSMLIGGGLHKVHPSAQSKDMIINGSSWFQVNSAHVGQAFKDVFKNYRNYLELAKRQGHFSRENFSYGNMKEKLENILDNRVPQFAQEVSLQLPQLKGPGQSTLPELKKIENKDPQISLPKLKKIN